MGSIESGKVQAFNHRDRADTFDVDKTVGEASADDYDGLMLPGGAEGKHEELAAQAGSSRSS